MFAAVALKRMKRREFITVIGGAATLYPFAAGAQQPAKIRRVGVLINLSENDLEAQRLVTVFRDGLAQLRWVDGRNLRLLQQGSSERELRVDPRDRRPQSGVALFQPAPAVRAGPGRTCWGRPSGAQPHARVGTLARVRARRRRSTDEAGGPRGGR